MGEIFENDYRKHEESISSNVKLNSSSSTKLMEAMKGLPSKTIEVILLQVQDYRL